MIALDSL